MTIEQSRIDAFLKELFELSLKHRISIGGCGCCGSPFLSDMTGYSNLGKTNYIKYTSDKEQNLEMVEECDIG